MKARICLLLVLAMAFSLAAGCGWVGRTAGKAQAKLERSANAVQEGYEEGYEEEKAKEGKTRENKELREDQRQL